MINYPVTKLIPGQLAFPKLLVLHETKNPNQVQTQSYPVMLCNGTENYAPKKPYH